MVSIFLKMVDINSVNEFGEYHKVCGSNMLIVKKPTLCEAKSYVSAKFAEGYYNYALIHDKADNKTYERIKGTEWKKVKEDMKE